MRELIITTSKKLLDEEVQKTWADHHSYGWRINPNYEVQKYLRRYMIVPPSDAAQRRTLADATVTRGLHHDGLTGHATTSAFVPVDLNYGSLSAAAGLSITAAVTAGGAVAHDCPSPSPLQADDPSSFVSATASATAAVFDT